MDEVFDAVIEFFPILFVGGDTRYGLGKIRRVQWNDLSAADLSVFGQPVYLDKENPVIQSDFIGGHASEDGRAPIQGMQGMKELLGGWIKVTGGEGH